MQATRQHILDYLSINNNASALEISRTFGMSAANVRHHLKALFAQGHIIKLSRQISSQRGRPEIRFSLAESKNQPAILLLTQGLLAQFGQSTISKYPATCIKKLAKQLVGEIKLAGSLSQRLVNIVQRLSQLGYQPTWEATAEGPEIVFNRCPYLEIIDGHPELCRMDVAALELGLKEKIGHLDKLVINSEGAQHCRFRIKNS